MKMTYRLFFTIIAIAHIFFSCQKEELIDISNKNELDKVIESEYKRLQMPGVACIAVKADSIVYSYATGYSDKQENKPFTLQTRMLIASVSKTITLTAIMQLYDKGLIRLDSDINEYLPFQVRNPGFPNNPITVRMLLTHTSSISDEGFSTSFFYLFGYVDYPESLMSFEQSYLTAAGQYYSKKNFSENAPGTTAEYSNVGAALVACLVENISGKDFNSYCKENIFQPLGMSKTTWFFSETPKDEIAIPYADNNIENPAKPFYTYPTYPDGHLITSIDDLSKFLRAYILGGSFNNFQILKPETVDLILTKNLAIGVGNLGLIFFEHSIGEFSVWGHDGGDPGVSTEMYFDKEKKIGYIMFNNRSSAYSQTIGTALLLYANQK